MIDDRQLNQKRGEFQVYVPVRARSIVQRDFFDSGYFSVKQGVVLDSLRAFLGKPTRVHAATVALLPLWYLHQLLKPLGHNFWSSGP